MTSAFVAHGDPGPHTEPSPPASAADEAVEIVIIDDESFGTLEAGTASLRIVSPEDIALTPSRSADDVLRLVPGLHISQHASEGKAQQFFLRGFDAIHGADLELKVAGVRINEMSNVHGNGYIDIGFVPPEVIGSIHAHKGSFDLSQGLFGTAGTVEVELGVAPTFRGHRVSYEVGSTNRHRILALSAPVSMPEQSFVAIEVMADDGFGENRATERISTLAQHRFELSTNDRKRHVDLFAGLYAARFGEPGTLPLDGVQSGDFGFFDAFDDETDGRSQRALVGARFSDRGDGQRLALEASAGMRRLTLSENFTGFLINEEMGDTRGQRHQSMIASGRARLEKDFKRETLEVTAVVGGGVSGESIEQSEEMLDTEGQPWMDSRELEATQLTGDLLAGVRIQRGPARAEIGARMDVLRIEARDRLAATNGTDTDWQVSPRVATSYNVTSKVAVFAAYGRGLRPAEARSVASEDAQGRDQITSSDAVEVGTLAHLGHHATVGVTAFGIRIGNELVFDHLSGVNVARNSTRRLGAEVSAEIHATDWVTLRGDVTATDARFEDSGALVPYAPRLMATAEARVRHDSGLSAGAQWVTVAPRPLAHGATGKTVAVMNLVGNYRWQSVDLGLEVDNVFNTQWREGEYHYASRFDPTQPASQIPKTHVAAGRPLGARVSLTAWF